MTLEVSALYNRLYTMRKSEETLSECGTALRSLAELMEPVDKLIKAALQEESEGENAHGEKPTGN
jgi:hypothetical protein